MTKTASFLTAGILACLLIAGLLSPFASSQPDGLEKAVAEMGIEESDDTAGPAAPLPDYSVPGIEREGLSTGLAGAIGVAATFALAYGLARLGRRRSPRSAEAS